MNKKSLFGIAAVFIVVAVGIYVYMLNLPSQSDTRVAPNGVDSNTMYETGGQASTTGGVRVPTDTQTTKEFIIEGKNFSFSPTKISVKKGDRVRIIFKNTGGFHDLVIDEYKVATKRLGDGEQETVEFVADKVGSFEYYCSVGQHRAMGMIGTLVVE